MASNFTLSTTGVAEVLRSVGMMSVVSAAADAVATTIEQTMPSPQSGQWSGVELGAQVETIITDRASASVWVHDPRAMWYEASTGLVTNAAAHNGLKVSGP